MSKPTNKVFSKKDMEKAEEKRELIVQGPFDSIFTAIMTNKKLYEWKLWRNLID